MLSNKKIMIIGASPLGFRLASLFAESKIEKLLLTNLAKPSYTDISNSVFSIADFGTSSWNDVLEKLKQLNPTLYIEVQVASLKDLQLKNFDFIFDCSANGEVKELLSEDAMEYSEVEVFFQTKD